MRVIDVCACVCVCLHDIHLCMCVHIYFQVYLMGEIEGEVTNQWKKPVLPLWHGEWKKDEPLTCSVPRLYGSVPSPPPPPGSTTKYAHFIFSPLFRVNKSSPLLRVSPLLKVNNPVLYFRVRPYLELVL